MNTSKRLLEEAVQKYGTSSINAFSLGMIKATVGEEYRHGKDYKEIVAKVREILAALDEVRADEKNRLTEL